MTTKVDRLAPRTPARTETAAPTTATASAAVQAPVADSEAEPSGVFDPNAAPRSLTPSGPHVPNSARPDALWGEAREARQGGHVHSPEEIARARTERRELQGKIADRVNHLDQKWRYTRNTNKLAELEKYTGQSDKLDPDTRTRLQPKLAAAHAAEQKLATLQEQAKALGKGGTPEQRTALAKQISSARREVSTTVSAATKVIDDAGLQVDRLAHAEKDIDPNGAKDGWSLFSMLKHFFSLTYIISSVHTQLDVKEELLEQQQTHNREVAIKTDLQHQRVLLQELQQEIAHPTTKVPIRG